MQRKRNKQTAIRDLPGRQLGEPYGSMIEATMDVDRQWFEEHPGRDQYVRDYRAGEFGTKVPSRGSRVLVTQVFEGCRCRTAVPAEVTDLVESGVHVFTHQEKLLRSQGELSQKT